MKLIISAMAFAALIVACEPVPKQYTEESPQIETVKEVMKAYVDGNFETYSQHYTEDAEIYHNSIEAKTLEETIASDKEMVDMFSEYGFADEMKWDMVTTDDGELWVGFWGVWHGTMEATGHEFTTPVHLSLRIEEGKIAQEWGYWDNAPLEVALMELAVVKEADSDSEE